MTVPRVAVLRGGQSREYDVSMRTGGAVLRSLARLQYPAKDIVITREGEWLEAGRVRAPEMTLTGIDVVLIALHGEHGEDGRVQRFLTNHHIRYTGSRGLASATALNKFFAKQLVAKAGVATPRFYRIDRDTVHNYDAKAVQTLLGERVVVKPLASGSSVDTYVNVPAAAAEYAVRDLLRSYDAVLLEEYIAGKEVTVGLIEGFRDTRHYMLPVIEIIPSTQHTFFSYDAKYGGETCVECPARVSKSEQQELYDTTQRVHELLDLRHYSRTDFIVRDGEVFFLEVNSLPGLTETSLFPQGLQAVGASYDQFIAHLVAQAHY